MSYQTDLILLSGCFDVGGISGVCDSTWNDLTLDGSVATGSHSKYTSFNLDFSTLQSVHRTGPSGPSPASIPPHHHGNPERMAGGDGC